MPSTANISHDFTGFFLIGGHAVVFSYFLTSTVLFSLVKGVEPFCWPFFENCGQYRLESPGELRIVSLAYLALILLALYTRLLQKIPIYDRNSRRERISHWHCFARLSPARQ
jgi:hypothetical protein